MAISLGELRTEAANIGQQYGFAPNSPAGDAFRHAYTSAILTQTFNADIARLGGNAVELLRPNNPERDRNMDLLNNALGRAVGGSTTTPTEAANRIADLIRNGTAVTDWQSDPRTDPNNFPPELLPLPQEIFPQGDPFTGMPWGGTAFSPTTITQAQQSFNDAETWICLSPLILDLDGNGVNTRALADGTYFDHDANGLAESTGWVGTGDALLVRDINGNGVIDNGGELFGNNTLLANGSRATNGFAALALDANGDGQVNAQDAAWSSLRLWRDADADGITDAGELTTLTAAGVQSVGTGYTNNSAGNVSDAQGNWHRQSGVTCKRYAFNSYLRSDLLNHKPKFHLNRSLRCGRYKQNASGY